MRLCSSRETSDEDVLELLLVVGSTVDRPFFVRAVDLELFVGCAISVVQAWTFSRPQGSRCSYNSSFRGYRSLLCSSISSSVDFVNVELNSSYAVGAIC